MSIYITPQDELHVEHEGIALTCPHCRTLTHLTPIAVPKFDDLSRRKPSKSASCSAATRARSRCF